MSTPIPAKKILASVELGNPSADCAHFGICSIQVLSTLEWIGFKPLHIRHLKAILSVTETGHLRFEFPLKSIRSDTRTHFFPPEGFRVDSAIALPLIIGTVLQLPNGVEILIGVYAIRPSSDGLVLEFSLSTTKPA